MEVRERPVSFSPEMMLAMVKGLKTVTRRIVCPQPIPDVAELKEHSSVPGYWIPYSAEGKLVNNNIGNRKDDCGYYCRYGKTGERLWTQEPYVTRDLPDGGKQILLRREFDELVELLNLDFVAEAARRGGEVLKLKWLPGFFMPRKLSRGLLEITNVRAGRVQDITENEALAEGLESYGVGVDEFQPGSSYIVTARELFQVLWDRLNAKRGFGWEVNPWVFPVEFKVLEIR